MYNGQVNVSQDRLQTFLAAAELLQIKGLTDVNDKEEPAKVGSGKQRKLSLWSDPISGSSNRKLPIRHFSYQHFFLLE